MSITSDLEQILSARYGKDVRHAIHDSIEEGYNIAVQAQGIAETSQESAKAYAQAALASEQAAEDYKTAAEQAAEQAMSGTPEGYADLVAKVNSIYRQTATSYNVVGTKEGSALARTIYGMSVQDGTPTPSVPVEIKSAKADFKCVGKNLIPYPYYNTTITVSGITIVDNGDGSVTVDGTATASKVVFRYINNDDNKDIKLEKKKYILSTGGISSGDAYHAIDLGIKDKDGSTVVINATTTNTIIDNTDGKYQYIFAASIWVANGTTINNVTIKPMLTLADAGQTFELYQHTDVTTDLTLRAIEVASTDNYNLVKDGKYYIADTVDWSEDKGYQITRRIGEIKLDGTETGWTLYGDGSTSRRFDILNTSLGIQLPATTYQKSNRFVFSTTNTGEWGTFRFSFDGYLILKDNQSVIPNADALKTWLISNPTYIDYILATPTTESITSEQAQALLSLKTYDETTSISAIGDIEPSLDLEYSKDRNTALALTGHNLAHKNALKLNDINTALIELGGN